MVVPDPYAPPPPTSAPLLPPANQGAMSPHYPSESANAITAAPSKQQLQRVHSLPQPQSIAYQGFDVDEVELDVDQTVSSTPSSGARSAPDTLIPTPFFDYPFSTPSVATYAAVSPLLSSPCPPTATMTIHTTTHTRAISSARLRAQFPRTRSTCARTMRTTLASCLRPCGSGRAHSCNRAWCPRL